MYSVSVPLFILLIVWILNLNPKLELSHLVTDEEKKICEKNYKWLRYSSFITVPVFLVAIFMDAHPALAAIIPFIFHVALARRLGTDNLFVFRHTQQALFLLILRAATAAMIFSFLWLGEGFWIFISINGLLWLFGTNWEIKQVKNNDCWLMRRKGETINVRDTKSTEKSSDSPVLDKELKNSLRTLNQKGKEAIVNKSLKAFRTGTPETRKKAILVLSELGEVEKF